MKLPCQSPGVIRYASGGLFTLTAMGLNSSIAGVAGIQPQQSCSSCTGYIGGSREEEEYISCYSRCRSGGGHHSGCRTTCCCEVTGCYSCIFL